MSIFFLVFIDTISQHNGINKGIYTFLLSVLFCFILNFLLLFSVVLAVSQRSLICSDESDVNGNVAAVDGLIKV